MPGAAGRSGGPVATAGGAVAAGEVESGGRPGVPGGVLGRVGRSLADDVGGGPGDWSAYARTVRCRGRPGGTTAGRGRDGAAGSRCPAPRHRRPHPAESEVAAGPLSPDLARQEIEDFEDGVRRALRETGADGGSGFASTTWPPASRRGRTSTRTIRRARSRPSALIEEFEDGVRRALARFDEVAGRPTHTPATLFERPAGTLPTPRRPLGPPPAPAGPAGRPAWRGAADGGPAGVG